MAIPFGPALTLGKSVVNPPSCITMSLHGLPTVIIWYWANSVYLGPQLFLKTHLQIQCAR